MTWTNIASPEAAQMIHERMTAKSVVTPTGLPTVDRSNFLWGDRRGIPQGSYVLVGGASNVGKTLFGLHMLMQAAKSGQKCDLIMLDMKNRDVLARFHQAIVPKIGFQNWRPSRWKEGNLTTLKDGLFRFRDTLKVDPLDEETWGDVLVEDDRNRQLKAIVEKIRQAADLGFTFFVIDHLQKVRVQGVSRGDVYASADVVSETLDDLVDELNVTVLGLSQLNRNASRETDRRPTMFDLHGGTGMESNASIVMMLDHSRVAMDELKHHIIRTYLLLEKNQAGPKNRQIPIEVNAAELSIREVSDGEAKTFWPKQSKGGRS